MYTYVLRTFSIAHKQRERLSIFAIYTYLYVFIIAHKQNKTCPRWLICTLIIHTYTLLVHIRIVYFLPHRTHTYYIPQEKKKRRRKMKSKENKAPHISVTAIGGVLTRLLWKWFKAGYSSMSFVDRLTISDRCSCRMCIYRYYYYYSRTSSLIYYTYISIYFIVYVAARRMDERTDGRTPKAKVFFLLKRPPQIDPLVKKDGLFSPQGSRAGWWLLLRQLQWSWLVTVHDASYRW